MKEVYNKLFNKVASRMSDDELFGRVLNSREVEYIMDNNSENKKKAKKRGVKMIAAPIAAVMATAGLTVGAFAVYNHNVSREFNDVLRPGASVFPQERKDSDGKEIDTSVAPVDNELYEQLNIVIDKTFECDDFTLEVPGAICDGKDMLVMYNAVFDEDPGYEENENVFMDFTPLTDGAEWGCGHYAEAVFSKQDGKTIVSSFIELNLESCTANTVKVNLNCLWGSHTDNWYDSGRFFDIELSIPLTDDITKFNKTVEIPSKPHVNIGDWGEWDMTDIEITPLSVTFNMHSDGIIPSPSVHKYASPAIPMTITFKDGTTLDISGHGGMTHGIDPETKTTVIDRPFNFPIKVEDIKSVQFASAVIYMDGSAQTIEIPEIIDPYTKGDDEQK